VTLRLLTYSQDELYNSLEHLELLYNEEQNRSVYNVIRDIKEDNYRGWISILFDGTELISCAALEKSEKYTGDQTSLRFCRYYKLKSKRKIRYNFYNYLEEYVAIAKENKYKIIYFTVFNPKVYKDILRSKSNKIYEKYKKNFAITDFKLRNDILFKINNGCVQQIFEYKTDDNFKWNPDSEYIIPKSLYTDKDIEDLYNASVDNGLV
jgi:hypothetical protein